MKKFFTFLLVVILLAIGLWLWQGRGPKAPVGPINMYSLQGKVVSVLPDKLVVSVGGVEQTKNGNQFVVSEKTVNLAASVTFLTGTSSVKVAAANVGSRLHANDQAIFYGTAETSPFSGGLLTVNKIKITSSGATPALPKGAPVVR